MGRDRAVSLLTIVLLACVPALVHAQTAAPAACPMVLDFDTDADGIPILAGQDVGDAYASWGIDTIIWATMAMTSYGTPIAFDSSNPTGGDWDLGTPNQAFGGPGVGSGGGPGPYQNDWEQGNLLIVAENTIDANGDGYVDNPDDNAGGGWFVFSYDQPTCVFGTTIIDTDANETTPDLLQFAPNGSQIAWVNTPVTGGNGVTVITYEYCGVDHSMFDIYGSGAFDDIQVCVGGTPEVCDGVDNDGDGDVDESFTDTDGDGSADCVDCDDNDPDNYPGNSEVCDGEDNDCDSAADEDFDADGDGYTTCGGDCDDADAAINPGADEDCDGIDNDCDGEVDEDTTAVNAAQADQWNQYGWGHALVLPGMGSFVFSPDGQLQEHSDGTATLTGTAVKSNNTNWILEVDVTFANYTVVPGPGSPKLELVAAAYTSNGGPVDPATWRYYTDSTGVLTGAGALAGASISVWDVGPAFQAGNGASGKNAAYGASGWIGWSIDSQPSSSLTLVNSSHGDWNLDLVSTCGDEICDGIDNDGDGDIDEGFDADNDGWTTCAGDCDDNNPNTNPDCPDVCNGIDDDCDGSIDEDFDADGDGYTSCNGDCDDSNAAINPGATEVCNGLDDDCDGAVPLDELDTDGDGVAACEGDCDPTDGDVFPGADEVCNGVDDDCDGEIDEDGADLDGDGFSCDDCDDTDASVYPGAPEDCDGVDDDCDGVIDNGAGGSFDLGAASDFNVFVFESFTDAYDVGGRVAAGTFATLQYFSVNHQNPGGDALVVGEDMVLDDGTVYGDAVYGLTASVAPSVNFAAGGGLQQGSPIDFAAAEADLEATSAALASQAATGTTVVQPWNGIELDGQEAGLNVFSVNGADLSAAVVLEIHSPVGSTVLVNVGGTTVQATSMGFSLGGVGPDDVLFNFSQATDLTIEQISFQGSILAPHADVAFNNGNIDGQLVANSLAGTGEPHWVQFDGDLSAGPCEEICDGLDNDGDGQIDEGFDLDSDGVTSCGGDCDDGDPNTWPGAPELCDWADNDCDGSLSGDETDDDGDGYDECGGDCDDTDSATNPTATELCNGVDDDCDGSVDEGYDADADGYSACDGDCDDSDPNVNPAGAEACNGADDDCDGVIPADEADDDGDGWSGCDGDCDDADPNANPGATEACNGVDDDCDGVIPADEADDDGDGVSECGGDCDDADDTMYPGAPELCDGADNDCDGAVDWTEVDFDGDGYANCDGDCNEYEAGINPGADEVCDGLDNDCDGLADEGFDADSDGMPDCIDACPQIIDFDSDPWGNAIMDGDDVTNAYAWWGISIERFEDPAMAINTPVLAYDSGDPLPGDEELGTPNADFGGPGLGAGGGAGAPGENWREHANVMKTGDGNTWYIVEFNTSTCVHAIQLIDVDEAELAAQVILFDVTVQTIDTVTSSGLGDNSVETLDLGGTCGVYVMMIDFYAQGAWDNLVICSDPNVEPEICDDGIDNDGDSLVDVEDTDCMPVDDDDDDDDGDDDDDDDSASVGDDDDDDDEGDPDCSVAGSRASGGAALWLLIGLGLVGLRRRT